MSQPEARSDDPPRTLASRRALLKALAGGAIGSAFLAAGWGADAAVPRHAADLMRAPLPRLPVKLVVVFGHPDDVDAFEAHYEATHIPLALAMPYCESIESAFAVGGPAGEEPAFHRIDTLTFASEADMAACVASEAGQAALADFANFATGGATATIVSGIQAFHRDDAVAEDSEVRGLIGRGCRDSSPRRVAYRP